MVPYGSTISTNLLVQIYVISIRCSYHVTYTPLSIVAGILDVKTIYKGFQGNRMAILSNNTDYNLVVSNSLKLITTSLSTTTANTISIGQLDNCNATSAIPEAVKRITLACTLSPTELPAVVISHIGIQTDVTEPKSPRTNRTSGFNNKVCNVIKNDNNNTDCFVT